MIWLYPQFLWALLALAIPVAIHLFNFRRYKKIIFPNLRFLTQINQQTKSGNQLKKYLILASRLLALIFLVFAFAQPVLLHNDKRPESGKAAISIIIDNSYSMNLNGEEGQLLEAAKNRARAIVNASSNSDEFNIITSDLNPALLHFHGKQSTLDNIDKIKIASASHPLKDLLDVQARQLKDKSGNKLSYCISDFQNKNSVITKNPLDSTIRQTWIKLNPAEASNISIDTCYLESPILQTGQTITLVAKVSNYTSKEVEGLTVELLIDDKPKGIAVFNIPSFGSEIQKINFTLETGGNHSAKLKLPGDNIPLDDELFFSLRMNQKYNVISIGKSDEKYVNAVFSDNTGFGFKAMESGSVNYGSFKSSDLIVLQGADNIQSGLISELKNFIKNGGTVMAFPSKDAIPSGGLGSFSQAFGFVYDQEPTTANLKVNRLDLEHPVFNHIFEKQPKNPDLPLVSKYYKLKINGGAGLMKLADGSSFLHDLPLGKGHLIVCASALDRDWTNFQSHALFLPVLMKSAMLGNYRTALYQSCGESNGIATGLPYENETGIRLISGQNIFVPEVMNRDGEMVLNTNGEISSPGQYELRNKTSDSVLSYLSFNINRNESDTRVIEENEFEKLSSNFGINTFEGSAEKLSAEFSKTRKGVSLWKWCIIFVLIFLMIEILLIRFFRNNAKLPA
ncbi:MAG TPA: BatA domain-containing protein [Bacteroidia bacterium]